MKCSVNHRLSRKAFSLIELLVVIGLIGVLSSLLIIGIGKMRTNGKRQQTNLILTNLAAMYSDYDANTHLPLGIGHIDFSKMQPTEQSAMLNSIYLASPTNVSTDGMDRTGSIVQLTRDFMGQLMQYPANATAVGKMPASALMTFMNSYPTGAGAWSAGTTYSVYSAAYVTDPVTLTNNVYYRTQVYCDSSAYPADNYGKIEGDISQNAPPNPYFWMPALGSPAVTLPLSTPVILDGWGNPIIFVMGGVLGAPSTSTTGLLTAGGNTTQVHAPDYRPFFASAGPDGDFSKGDDNMYSFEK